MAGHEPIVLDLLKDVGLITDQDIESAKAEAQNNRQSVLDILVGTGHLTQLDVTKAIANTAGIEFIDRIEDIPEEVIHSVPKHIAKRYRFFPLERMENLLRIALSDPFDLETIDSISFLLKTEIDPVVVPLTEIERALVEHYGSLSDLEEEKENEALEGPDLTNVSAEDAPIIKLVHSLILEAHKSRASDIHIEPLEKKLRVRYRIDGVLQEMQGPPKSLQSAIVSRIKIMSNMSIAEKRLPQDGRIQLSVGAKTIDLRVSSVPTNHGESIVMRILDKGSLMLGLPELGFLSDDQQVIERILGFADGIFLVTGPTGSGKTTTLYGCLNYLNKPDRKIITAEDPVEYILPGINQVQINEDVDMTFAAALRSMLRQAPNIIMVGEIRDAETANIAINASLTGHLVFSTLHTNDAPGAITRLVDIGVKPFLVASSLKAVMAQRLVRKLCPKCKQPHDPSESELQSLGIKPSQITEANFMEAVGCEACLGSGYKGRLGIFEIFVLNDEARRMITENASHAELRARARQLGMRTLREDGIRKVLAGITSVSEVLSATMGDKA
ncbi:MAG: Flp pilus assembly complex ATPase component TadA [Verrucomicrobiae bacterium]|nr:Flp pilus assembly complex ATPase component TadA [Verrucomicrobiae bacterium]